MDVFKKVLTLCCIGLSTIHYPGTSTTLWGQDLLLSRTAPNGEFNHQAFATLLAHWPLSHDTDNKTELILSSTGRGIAFESVTYGEITHRAARFDGHSSLIEVADSKPLQLGTEPFSIALWVNIPESGGDTIGDLISKYDYESRTGFHLGVYSHAGVTNSQPNCRQLHFGIDSGRIEPKFQDHGRLGDAVYVFSLCVHAGRLYASTCTADKNQAGHVYRFESDDQWTDLGSPDKANSISAMTTFEGQLFVASSKYRLAGSSLAESENPNLGGSVYRLTAEDRWEFCGNLSPETEAVASLIEYQGQLYASSLYRPAGFFRYRGGQIWENCPTPDNKRVEAMSVFNKHLYATCYDEGSVFRFDGHSWENIGEIPDATQTYGLGVYRGQLYVSEWPQAHVFRYKQGRDWEDVGKLGQELEAMPLLVYNGKMYGGTLPKAEVYRYDEQQIWTKIDQVDHTPDVKYRRAWSMAVYQGRLFVGTLPGGRVLSIEAGRNATYDHQLAPGWRQIVAVRDVDQLRLYVDGRCVGQSAPLAAEEYDLSNLAPLLIGFGAQDHLDGSLADVRLYRGVLSEQEIADLSKKRL
jgi:gamma-glutamylcyclotransferase (GGCT)/AIG2-like uncharacterized protein YtfP